MYVLYAEDDDDIARLVVSVFGASCENVTLIRVTNGVDAFHEFRLRERIPKGASYDVIISDYLMPTMDGAELAIAIRKEYGSSIPIIMHTSCESSDITHSKYVNAIIPKSEFHLLVDEVMRINGIHYYKKGNYVERKSI